MKQPLDSLPDDLAHDLRGRDVIVFDGECVLCSGFFRFVVAQDADQRFTFATAQGPFGQRLYAAMGLPTDRFDTNLVVVGDHIYGGIDSFGAVMRRLGGWRRILAQIDRLPGPLKRPLYRVIAQNRYRIFGRYNTCMIPTPQLRARFLT